MSNEAIEALLAEASRLYNEGEYRKAIKKWEEVLSLDPENQKAKESINIASLLSDTWSEGGDEPAPEPVAAAPQSPQEMELEEGIARIRSRLEARDFAGAFADCEALAPAAGDNADLKTLTEQARSGLEAEPFIQAALDRALKELRAGNFETVEVLCSKVLSLDSGNRDARNYLVMAQRRTTEVEPESAGEPELAPGDPAAVVTADSAASTAPGPEPVPATAPVAVAPEPAAAEAAAPAPGDVPVGAPAEDIQDPLAALGMDLGADLSPLDLAGPVGEEPVPVPEISGQVADAAGAEAPPVASSPQPGEEIDGGAVESIPLAGAPPAAPVTRQGSDIIQDGSIYSETEGGEAVAGPPAAPGLPPGAPAGPIDPDGMSPDAALDMPAPGADERPVMAPAKSSAKPAPRPAARGGGGFLKSAFLLLLLAGLGVGGWYVYQIYYAPVDPSFSEDLRANVAPASGPATVTQPEKQQDPGSEEAAVEEQPPVPEEPIVMTDEPKLPQDPETRRALAQARYQEGRRFARAGKVRQAMRVLEEALELDPVLFEAKDLHDELAQQIVETARFDEDIATVRRAMEDHDYHSALWKLYRMQEALPSVKGWDYNIACAWYNWGILLLKAGNLQEAIGKFDEVLGIYPDDREASRQRGVAERYHGRDRDVAYHNYVDALDMRRFKLVAPPPR